MKFPKTKRLSMSGFSHHLLLPVIAILAVGAIGTYVLTQTHAATCMDYTYSAAGSTNTNTGGGSATVCVNYAQKILNGEYQADPNFAWWGTNQPGQAKFTGYLTDNGVFNTVTGYAVDTFQGYFANAGTPTVAGTIGSQTWAALCGIGLNMPNPDASHYWEQEAKGAAQHSGCTTQTEPLLSGGGSVRGVFQASENSTTSITPGQHYPIVVTVPSNTTPTITWYVVKVVPGIVTPTTPPVGAAAPACTETTPAPTAVGVYLCQWLPGTLPPSQVATAGQYRWFAKIATDSTHYQFAVNSSGQPYVDINTTISQ
ncbi:MAG TPA: hypothetical protein VMB52_06560 [Verrucomicrobiae bacterium]|nr:hypothetical protein [Verrucomicrobiae bacterium]